MRSERKIIERILRMYPLIYGLADEIEQEQDALISDMALPATVVVEKLIELDNRRIDLCNLKVLRGFIERGLGERYELLNACAFAGVNSALYKLAAKQLLCAGYTAERCEAEFSYLFKLLKKKPGRKKLLPKLDGTASVVSGARN